MQNYLTYLLILGTVLLQIKQGKALKCWFCAYDRDCVDPFQPDEIYGEFYELRECPSGPVGLGTTKDDTPVCIKGVVKIPGPFPHNMVVRKCATRGEMETLNCFPRGLGVGEQAFCESCEEDGCNSATRVSAGVLLFAPLVLLLSRILKTKFVI